MVCLSSPSWRIGLCPVESMLAVVVINYRQTAATLACLESLRAHAGAGFDLFLIDNAADADSRTALSALTESWRAAGQGVELFINEDNLGFTGGCNQAFARILEDRRFKAVALLNNDTLVQPDWLARLADGLDPARGIGMVAGSMRDAAQPEHIDSLGIVLYRSGIAANRKNARDPLLGPCGGSALYSVELLRALRASNGNVFDPDFFCYAEDTDLALRARALGYGCAYAEGAVVLHRGSLSSGGASNTFIAYYGLRNATLAMIKTLPANFLWRNLFWIVGMQFAVILKYLIKGHPQLIWRIYRDIARALPRALRQRRCIQREAVWSSQAWRAWTSARFYDRHYIRNGLRTLLHRDLRPGAL